MPVCDESRSGGFTVMSISGRLENIREKLSIILPFSRKMVNDSEESLTVSMISEKFDSFNDFRKVLRFLVRAGFPLLFTRCANSYRPCAA